MCNAHHSSSCGRSILDMIEFSQMKLTAAPSGHSPLSGVPLAHRSFAVVAITAARLSFTIQACQASPHGYNTDGKRLLSSSIDYIPHASRMGMLNVPFTTNSTVQWTNKKFVNRALVQQETPDIISDLVEKIRQIFRSLGDGQISMSAYDTAWVARVPALDGSNRPEFPKALQWIIDNQLPDGSWGDKHLFLSHDRVCSTLACVIALREWKASERCINKGLEFIQRSMAQMINEEIHHMPIGFEVVFLTMLDDSKDLGLELPYTAPILRHIRSRRDKKLERIPLQVLHERPTTLLYSLEGLHKLVNWEKIMKLQSKNGSFLNSPASTACALMYTHDKGCLNYLKDILKKFDNAVPNVYPIDLFERLWIVDRLERLGIAHYFKTEIKCALDYVYRYWTMKGISWGRETTVQDIDDTSMGFRLLRLHNYNVSADVFQNFHKDGEFFCVSGQTEQAVTGMFNLYRASQTLFPYEDILETARSHSKEFLMEKRENGELHDKWIIMKDLEGEVEFALNNPWNASLERLEIRKYIDQYGSDDVWIGKSLYRMPYVNNTCFLELAKADFNFSQCTHIKEFSQIRRWYIDHGLLTIPNFEAIILEAYGTIVSSLHEPRSSFARVVWAQCYILQKVILYYVERNHISHLIKLLMLVKRWDCLWTTDIPQDVLKLFMCLHEMINTHATHGLIMQDRDISLHLRNTWYNWLNFLLLKNGEVKQTTMEDYLQFIAKSSKMEPVITNMLYFIGNKISCELFHQEYNHITTVTNVIVGLTDDIKEYKNVKRPASSSIEIYLQSNPHETREEARFAIASIVDKKMQELAQCVFQSYASSSYGEIYFHTARVMNFICQSESQNNKVTHRSLLSLFEPIH